MTDTDRGATDVSWDEERGAYTTRFDGENGDHSPSVAVAEALESARDDRGRPLFEYVDPDALDALVTGSERTTVSFEVESATVTVRGDGRVFVYP